MKIDIRHTFKKITLAQYEVLFFDDAFNLAMNPVAGLRLRELLEKQENAGKTTRRLRVFPIRDFPGPVKKLMGDGELSYVEENIFDSATHTSTWTSKISVMPDKIKLGGMIYFSAAPGGVERRITADINVSVFGLGGMIEKLIGDNLKETYDKIAVFTQKWIDDGKLTV